MATPEISWLPLKVIEAIPCTMDNASEAPIPAIRPIHTEPLTEAMAAEKNAAASILPSRPMSKMPARSEKRPARQAKRRGVASRTVVSRICRSVRKSMPQISSERLRRNIRNNRSSGIRTILSRAPVKRITSA